MKNFQLLFRNANIVFFNKSLPIFLIVFFFSLLLSYFHFCIIEMKIPKFLLFNRREVNLFREWQNDLVNFTDQTQWIMWNANKHICSPNFSCWISLQIFQACVYIADYLIPHISTLPFSLMSIPVTIIKCKIGR